MAEALAIRFVGIRPLVYGILMAMLGWGSSPAVGLELGPPLNSPGEAAGPSSVRSVSEAPSLPAAARGSASASGTSTLRLVQEGWGQRRVVESAPAGSSSLRWRPHRSQDTVSRSEAFIPLAPANWQGREESGGVRRASYQPAAEGSSDVFANPFGDEPAGGEPSRLPGGAGLPAETVPADLPPLDELLPPLTGSQPESLPVPSNSPSASVPAPAPPASLSTPALGQSAPTEATAGPPAGSRSPAAASASRPGRVLSQPASPQPAARQPVPPHAESAPRMSPPAGTARSSSSGSSERAPLYRSPQVSSPPAAASVPPTSRSASGVPVRPRGPALPSSNPPRGNSGSRIYNQRDCGEEEENCQAARQALRQTSIRQISLDITAPFRPEAETWEEEEEARQDQLRLMPARVWRNRRGQELAEGRVIDLHHRRIVVQQDDETTRTIGLGDLGDDEMCFLAAYWRVPTDCTLGDETFEPRDWNPQLMTWKASSLCHKPLYFEERQLERYGHTFGPFVEPVLSGAHFFLNVAVLPYKMGINPPNECQYPLGYYRPGSCAPRLLPPVPISIRGGLRQASAVSGLAFMVP